MADNTNTDSQEFWGVQIWDITNPDNPYFTDIKTKAGREFPLWHSRIEPYYYP